MELLWVGSDEWSGAREGALPLDARTSSSLVSVSPRGSEAAQKVLKQVESWNKRVIAEGGRVPGRWNETYRLLFRRVPTATLIPKSCRT